MKKIFISLILVVIFSALAFSILRVKNVHLQSNSNCLDEKILQGKVDKKNIILLNADKLKEDIKKESSCVEDLTITKRYPNTVDFQLVQKEAVVRIDGSQFSATEDGLVVLTSSGTPRPTIFLPQGVEKNLGQKIQDPSVLFALKLVRNLQKSDFIPANVRITEQGDIAIYSSQEAIALFTAGRSVDLQVDSLQSVIAKAKIDPSKIAKIDLRFDKPVLIYK